MNPELELARELLGDAKLLLAHMTAQASVNLAEQIIAKVEGYLDAQSP